MSVYKTPPGSPLLGERGVDSRWNNRRRRRGYIIDTMVAFAAAAALTALYVTLVHTASLRTKKRAKTREFVDVCFVKPWC